MITNPRIFCCDCGVVPPGRSGKPPVCANCQLTRRLTLLLDDGTGTPAAHLAALASHLHAASTPEKMLHWLSRSGPADLLRALATFQLELTHEALHAWPRLIAADHLRHHLIACGLLASADQQLLAIEAWLHRHLVTATAHPHERLLRRFAMWHQLPRIRANAAARPLRATARQYATGQFVQAELFLNWLHDRGIEPGHVTQANIDNWYVTHKVHQRHLVRGFLLWATRHGHLPQGLRAPRVVFQPGKTFTQQRRLELLRRYLVDDTIPTPTRAAAVLLLLYAQPLSRIRRLTRDDLADVDNQPHLHLGDPPSPVPDVVVALLRQVTDDLDASGYTGRWLFPGRLPSQPIAYQTLHCWLRKLGFPLMDARVSALRQLVVQTPAPVIADALGFHQTTATRQRNHAGGTWNRYTSTRSGEGLPN
jgi:hypothetical protein